MIQRAQVLTVFLQRFIQGLPSFADLLRLASLAFFLDQQRDHANASSKAMAQEEEEDPGCCVQSPVMLQRQLSSRVPIRKLQLHIAYLRCSASCTHLAHAGEFGELMFESSVQEWLSARALAKELERVLRRRNGRPSTSSGSD